MQGKQAHSRNEMGLVAMATGDPWMRTFWASCYDLTSNLCVAFADERKLLSLSNLLREAVAGCFITWRNVVVLLT